MKTKDKILQVAEELFSERGITETSLRTITQVAEVNIAAVNYHFGSKKNLVQAVFHRLVQQFFDGFFERIPEGESVTRKQALVASYGAIVDSEEGMIYGRRFMKFLQAAYAQQQAHLRRYLQVNFHEQYVSFLKLLAGRDLSKEERFGFFWRLQFLLGAVMFTISEYQTLDDISESEYGIRLDRASLEPLFLSTSLAILETN